MSGERLRGVCLERTIELDNVRLRLRDWPGLAGPVFHVPDPLSPSTLIEEIAATFAPHCRVLSLSSRGDSPYVVDAIDLHEVLHQFGFRAPILVGEGLGCLTMLLVAAWYPANIGGLVLLNRAFKPPPGDSVAALALRDCPPTVDRLRNAVRCPMTDAASIGDVEAFLSATLP